MIKLRQLLESLDTPYKHSHGFETEQIDFEDEETGQIYKKDVLKPVQIIKFKTDEGIPYIWYARQNRYDDTTWEIAFGVETGKDEMGYKLDIELTGTGNAARIFATVINIINSFVEFDEDNFEIQRLTFSSKGEKRTKFYLNRLVPRIENFKLLDVQTNGDETEVVLTRTN
jgi:hypothetical protein